MPKKKKKGPSSSSPSDRFSLKDAGKRDELKGLMMKASFVMLLLAVIAATMMDDTQSRRMAEENHASSYETGASRSTLFQDDDDDDERSNGSTIQYNYHRDNDATEGAREEEERAEDDKEFLEDWMESAHNDIMDPQPLYTETLAKALQGDGESLYHVGGMYSEGRGVAIDHPKSILWWEKAAAPPINHMKSQHALGVMYGGNGECPAEVCKVNVKRAFEMTRRAASQGNAKSEL